MNDKPKAISKVLSGNDLGLTGSHQAGMLIPKNGSVLDFFPTLNKNIKNPRTILYFKDNLGKTWKLNFIYYNNRLVDPKGTRNEYRLTGMTAFFRENDLEPGDSIILEYATDEVGYIKFKRKNKQKHTQDEAQPVKRLHISLDKGWKVIRY